MAPGWDRFSSRLMSDWSMYELGDISWEEFGRSHDHIVSCHGGEPAHESIGGHDDTHQKQQHEVGTSVTSANDEPKTSQKADKISVDSSLVDGRSPLVESSWSRACTDAFQLASDPRHINVVSTSASQGGRISDSSFANHKIDSNYNVSSTNVSSGNVGVSDVSKMYQSSLAYVSPQDKEVQLLQYVKDRESNALSDYEWDDIGNFENVDRMFRNCGTAFAHGSIGSADELSWFSSSSHTIDGCEDTFNFGIQSSYPEFSTMTKSLELNEANMGFLLENDTLVEDSSHSSLGYCANTNWLDVDAEVSERMGGNETKVPTVTRNDKRRRTVMFNGPDMDSCQIKMPKGRYNAAERRKNGMSLKRINVPLPASSSETHPPLICHQNPFLTAGSNHLQPCDHHVKMESGHVAQQLVVKKSTSCVKSEGRSGISPSCEDTIHTTSHGHQSMGCSIGDFSMSPTIVAEEGVDKICHKKQLHVSPDGVKTCENYMCELPCSNHIIQQNKSFTSQCGAEGVTELAETSIECPEFEINYLGVQENSMITAFSDDISLGSSSFRELQDVLDKLDIRTKLCIRDGLFRLARNAEMRHCIDSIKHNGTGSSNSSEIPRMEELEQSSRFIVETGTNLIDRSIAHLLFYRASDSSTSPINYAMSHEFHITNEQNHGSSSTPSNA